MLISNRDIFDNFTNDILTPKLIDEAESILELLSVMRLYPNIVECFRILTNQKIFLKFITLEEIERKAINIMIIQKPQKSDNLYLLKEYFKIVYKKYLEEHSYPLIIKENFFVEYYKLFEGEEEDFQKNIIIIEIFDLYNSKIHLKINKEELIQLHLKKGISLLKNKKLKNLDFFQFIKMFPNLINDYNDVFDFFPYAVEFDAKDIKFINKIFNKDEFELLKYLGDIHYKL